MFKEAQQYSKEPNQYSMNSIPVPRSKLAAFSRFNDRRSSPLHRIIYTKQSFFSSSFDPKNGNKRVNESWRNQRPFGERNRSSVGSRVGKLATVLHALPVAVSFLRAELLTGPVQDTPPEASTFSTSTSARAQLNRHTRSSCVTVSTLESSRRDLSIPFLVCRGRLPNNCNAFHRLMIHSIIRSQ